MHTAEITLLFVKEICGESWEPQRLITSGRRVRFPPPLQWRGLDELGMEDSRERPALGTVAQQGRA